MDLTYHIMLLLCIGKRVLRSESCNDGLPAYKWPTYDPTKNEQYTNYLNQEMFTDLWGHKVYWNDPESSWSSMRKINLIFLRDQMKRQMQDVPWFTKVGLRKMKMPNGLLKYIIDQRNSSSIEHEYCHENHPVFQCSIVNNVSVYNRMKLLRLKDGSADPKIFILNSLHPILEKWCGKKLELNGLFYGIREYSRGAQMMLHVDRLPTHVISAILQVSQDVDEPWPLLVIDHIQRKRKIFLKPGEMLLYESATVPHGRQIPFNGNSYQNIFLHFYPKQY